MSKKRGWMNAVLMTLLLCAAAVPLTASGAVESTTEIDYFSGRVETVEWTDEKIAEFEQLNPSITVQHEFQKDASNVIKVKLASKSVPDLTTVVNQDFIDQASSQTSPMHRSGTGSCPL